MLKIGIIGTGMISDSFVKAATQLDEIESVAVLSRDYDRAVDYAAKNNIPKAYGDYHAMLQDKDIDAVYVALPNSLHFDYAMQALQSKKIVIIEKPYLSNVAEFDMLMALSQKMETKVFEMSRVLQQPNFKNIQAHLKDIEPVRMITINFSQYSRKYNDYLAGRIMNVFSDEYSGGALVDLGVYGVHFMIGLFGMPKSLTYVAQQLPNTIDVGGNLVLTYDGMIASLVQSKNSKCENRITIQGEKGTITASPTASRLDKVELDTTEKRDISVAHVLDGMAYNLRDIAHIIATNDELEYKKRTEQSRSVLEVLENARHNAGIVFKADQK